ncbi:hypothetical protein ACHAXR_001828 [Thalassiosira sp. AJA248-18]
MKNILAALFLLPFLPLLQGFSPSGGTRIAKTIQRNINNHDLRVSSNTSPTVPSFFELHAIDQKRKNQLGIPDDEDEYDLYLALSNNTDPGITKIIAGSFILVMVALLVVGLVIPSITDFGDGVCSPIQNGGRC